MSGYLIIKKDEFIGKTFGRLTVIDQFNPKPTTRTGEWLCRCECGNEKVVAYGHLIAGRIVSCGCYNKEAARKRQSKGYLDIFTEEFLRREHIEGKKTLRQICRENKCSLGCIIRYMKKYNLQANDQYLDIVGHRFGRLVVLNMAYTKNFSSYWNCKCDCGISKVIIGHSLVHANVVSCGCYNREKDWEGCGDLSKTYWSRAIKSAKDRSIEFAISMEYAWEKFNQQKGICAMSGIELYMDRGYSRSLDTNQRKQTASLDRIDSTLGYLEGNIQWIHYRLNIMKSNLSESEFIGWCKLVANHRDTSA